MTMNHDAQPETTQPACKIAAGLTEALRAATLVNAVFDVDGFEMTEQEAVQVLARLDATDPLRSKGSGT